MHQIYLFWNDTLHVSDGLSGHHQEFKTVHTATKQLLLRSICLLAGTHQQADSSICFTYACCCMYSLELLMMDEKTARNMQSIIPKLNKLDTAVHLVCFTIEIIPEVSLFFPSPTFLLLASYIQ